MIRIIGNIIWFLFGGLFMGIGWWIAGIVMYITVIGIPWGKSCFVIGTFSLFPFGNEAISRKELTQDGDIGTGKAGTLGNIIWFILGGWWLALGHLISAVLVFMTIIGIPFSIQHLKLAGLSLAPVGKIIISKEVAKAMRKRNAEKVVDEIS